VNIIWLISPNYGNFDAAWRQGGRWGAGQRNLGIIIKHQSKHRTEPRSAHVQSPSLSSLIAITLCNLPSTQFFSHRFASTRGESPSIATLLPNQETMRREYPERQTPTHCKPPILASRLTAHLQTPRASRMRPGPLREIKFETDARPWQPATFEASSRTNQSFFIPNTVYTHTQNAYIRCFSTTGMTFAPVSCWHDMSARYVQICWVPLHLTP